jgi:hypothetical protein
MGIVSTDHRDGTTKLPSGPPPAWGPRGGGVAPRGLEKKRDVGVTAGWGVPFWGPSSILLLVPELALPTTDSQRTRTRSWCRQQRVQGSRSQPLGQACDCGFDAAALGVDSLELTLSSCREGQDGTIIFCSTADGNTRLFERSPVAGSSPGGAPRAQREGDPCRARRENISRPSTSWPFAS